jgi:hypothetical protein
VSRVRDAFLAMGRRSGVSLGSSRAASPRRVHIAASGTMTSSSDRMAGTRRTGMPRHRCMSGPSNLATAFGGYDVRALRILSSCGFMRSFILCSASRAQRQRETPDAC